MTSAEFSSTIRAAAGHTSTPDREVNRPTGDIGIGRGGTCISREPRSAVVSMSNLIRGANQVRRQRLLDAASFYADVELEVTGGY